MASTGSFSTGSSDSLGDSPGSSSASGPAMQTRRRARAFHPDAYRFVFAALQYTQEELERAMSDDIDDESGHISGPELLDGVRALGLRQYGFLARTVFESWNVRSTADFGRIVFELIERGEMRKTDRDQESDFCDVYEFDQALEQAYEVDTAVAFA